MMVLQRVRKWLHGLCRLELMQITAWSERGLCYNKPSDASDKGGNNTKIPGFSRAFSTVKGPTVTEE